VGVGVVLYGVWRGVCDKEGKRRKKKERRKERQV